jgi:hypothetical protein
VLDSNLVTQATAVGMGADALAPQASSGITNSNSSAFPEITSMSAAAASPLGTIGLSAQYFNNKDLTTPILTRTDATVNFNWGQGSPDGAIATDNFSARWTGQILPTQSEAYTFYTHSDDGVKLWVNGQLLIDHWAPHAVTEDSGVINLVAGQKVDIQLDYYEQGGYAVAQLLWSNPTQVKEVVPQSQLFVGDRVARSQSADFTNAVDWGSLGTNETRDSVSPTNLSDYYRFSVDAPSHLNLNLSELTANANLNVLDSRGNVLNSSTHDGTMLETIDALLNAGTYYLQVYTSADVQTNYLLTAIGQSLTEQAKSADSFVDSMGVVTHLRYTDTSYGRHSDVVEPRLRELGIRNIRDGSNDAAMFEKLNRLANFGIRSTLVMDPRDGITPDNAVELLKKVLPSVRAIEGPNEWDVNSTLTYKGKSFPDGVVDYQTDLYKAVKGDAATSFVSVLAPSMAIPENGSRMASLQSVVDGGNMHSYAGGNQPDQDLDTRWIPDTKKVSGDHAIVATETGWHNAVNDANASQKGVSEEVSSKYIPRLFLEYFNRGVTRTFLYELMDERAKSDMENNFGLIRADGTPKPAFYALKNLISLLQDPQGSSASGSLSYYLTGDTKDVQHTLLKKSNGDLYLVMWLDVTSTDAAVSHKVTLNLVTPTQQATTYLTSRSTDPVSQFTSPTQITLDVPDAPLVVKLTPNATV